MYHLIYVSSAAELLNDAQLQSILEASRRNNEACGITGMLLYSGGNFMQVIEGPKDAVLTTHARISNDPRHNSLITLTQGECAARDFDSWSMGFKRLDSDDAKQLPGYSDFVSRPLNDPAYAENPSMSMKLLQQFRRNMR